MMSRVTVGSAQELDLVSLGDVFQRQSAAVDISIVGMSSYDQDLQFACCHVNSPSTIIGEVI
jgi:hypothetical protein